MKKFVILTANGRFVVAARLNGSVYPARNWTVLQERAREHVWSRYEPPFPAECDCPQELAEQARFS